VTTVADPDRLKAMLLAERAESERLRQIIKELQRYRFGRWAETLPEEQLQLGLEEAEQVEAAGQAETEEAASAERKARAARRRTNRGALPAHLPRIETLVDVASMICPGCSGTLHRNRRGRRRAARYRASPIPSAGRTPARNTPAGPVRTWWCRLRRRRG
jgi:hypothetical protein